MTETAKLSYSLLDYIESIDALTRIHGHAHTKDIAERMHVKMPSVTMALRQLAQRGYIHYSANRPVELTPQGQVIGNRVTKSHKALEDFFQRILALAPDVAHQAASSIDHIVAEQLVDRFLLFTRAISTRRDCHALAVHLSEAMEFLNATPKERHDVLSHLAPGTRCVVDYPSRNLEGTRHPALAQLQPGTVLESGEQALDGSACSVYRMPGRKRLVLPVAIAENIWVRLEAEGDGK